MEQTYTISQQTNDFGPGKAIFLILFFATIFWIGWRARRRRRFIEDYNAEAAKAQVELDAYVDKATAALTMKPDAIDWAELRKLYAATVDY